jgi:hypothetical protein
MIYCKLLVLFLRYGELNFFYIVDQIELTYVPCVRFAVDTTINLLFINIFFYENLRPYDTIKS